MEKRILEQAGAAANEMLDKIHDYKDEVRKEIQQVQDTMDKFAMAQPPKNVYLKPMVREAKDNAKVVIAKGDELMKRRSNLNVTFTGFQKRTKQMKAVISDTSVGNGEPNISREKSVFQSAVSIDQKTNSLTLMSVERYKMVGQKLTDTETRPKYSSHARSASNFSDVFQQIGENKMDEKHLTLARNASSYKNNDWYKILEYRSASNFTIQRNLIERELETFQKRLNKLAPSWSDEKNPKKDIIYVVSHDGKWVRGKFGDDLDKISFLKGAWFNKVDDIGNFKVSMNKCKIIEDNIIREMPPYAIWCGLFGIQKGECPKESSDLEREIIKNKLFKLFSFSPNVYRKRYVDLIFEANERFLSLKETLESAGILKPSRRVENEKFTRFMITQCKASKSTMEQHVNALKPPMNVPTPILIVHIESVCEFYCIQLKDASARARLKRDLKNTHASSSYETKLAYVPIEGMIYAAYINDYWRRVKVLESIGDGTYQVFSVDDGIKTVVHWRNLYHLEKEFAQDDQFIFEASLFKTSDADDEDKRTQEFRRIVDNADKFTGVFTDSIAPILIATITAEIDNKEYNVEQMLLKDQNVITTVNSLCTVPAKKPQKKIKIKIKHVVSPSEFYVVLNERQEMLEDLHDRIQDYVERDQKTKSKMDWNVGERCFVRAEKSEWYRGIVLKPKEECVVFLRDIGKIVTANLPEDLREDNMNEFMLGTVMRCHLAYLQPSSVRSWTLTACEQLKEYSLQPNEFAIDIPDISCVSPSVPVILWTSVDKPKCTALEPAKSKWHNVNLRMIHKGLAYPTTPEIDAFTPMAPRPCDEKHNHRALIENIIKRYGDNLDRSVTQIQIQGRGVAMHWLPANPPEAKDFIGVPEWVDPDLTVYLHTVVQHKQIAHMTEHITKWIERFGEDESINNWNENDICFAKFNGQYHRAEIKHVYKNEHRCMVYFVDYGNSCVLGNSDLSRYILYDDVPIMLHKLRLNSIKPINKSVKWTQDCIETLSQYICHKECNIFIHDSDNLPDSPLLCRIESPEFSLDAATFLIRHHKALRIERSNAKHDKSIEHLSKRSDNNKTAPLKIDHSKIQNLDDLRSGFQFNRILLPNRCEEDNVQDDNDFELDHSLVHCGQYQHKGRKAMQRIPNESTPGPDPTIITISSHYKLMQLDENRSLFKCRIVYVIDPITVLIKPEYAVEEKIDASSLSPLQNPEIDSPCVAFCSRTQTWVRGIIRSDRPSKNAMVVMFINDSLSSEIVPARKILKCSRHLLETPVNLAQVLLYGVQPNNRCRERDVRNELKMAISTNDEYDAIVKKFKDIPEVKFYDSDNNAITTMLVYRKFYKKIKKS